MIKITLNYNYIIIELKNIIYNSIMDKRDKKLLASIINYLDPRFTKIESEISSLKSDVSSLGQRVRY